MEAVDSLFLSELYELTVSQHSGGHLITRESSPCTERAHQHATACPNGDKAQILRCWLLTLAEAGEVGELARWW